MSYEGYTQCLCEKGHRFDGGDGLVNPIGVCDCGAPACWSNPVDTTNVDSYGVILDWTSLLEGVDEGGRLVYAVPCEGGPKVPARSYWDGEAYQLLPED